ncbi:MAG TPA: PGPGW domain-containing protein [Actinomycetota bacterium]|nr:PGPGW domain-containing protein [Actinomycetota bacterium]
MNPAAKQVARWIWFPFAVVLRFLLRNGKRIAVTIGGMMLLVAGMIMMVTPGPGLVVIIAGLAVLATEYVWAQRALNLAKRKAQQAKDKVTGRSRRGTASSTSQPDRSGSD